MYHCFRHLRTALEHIMLSLLTLHAIAMVIPIRTHGGTSSGGGGGGGGGGGVSCHEGLLHLLADILLWMCAARAAQMARTAAGGGGGVLNLLVDLTPAELHLPGHNFAGPGTDLRRRLRWRPRRRRIRRGRDSDAAMSGALRWRSFSAPTNAVDLAAYRHDVAYLLSGGDAAARRRADEELLDDVEDVIASGGVGSAFEVLSASFVWVAMAVKCAFGPDFTHL